MDVPDGETRLDVSVPVALFDVFVDLCRRNERPLKMEVIHAMERHASQPPEVRHYTTVEAPVLVAAVAVPVKTAGRKPRKRGVG